MTSDLRQSIAEERDFAGGLVAVDAVFCELISATRTGNSAEMSSFDGSHEQKPAAF
jgi:hypothetical protein